MNIVNKIWEMKRTFLVIPFLFFMAAEGLGQTKIMPLGDSITKGVTGSSNDAGYREALTDSLAAEGVTFDMVGRFEDGTGFDNEHDGFNGLEANELLAQIQDTDPNNNPILANPPNIVLLHIGTNDITSQQGVQNTRDEIDQIIDEIAALEPTADIILSTLIPRQDARDGDNDDLNALLQLLYLEKRDAGVNIYWAGNNEVFKCNPNWATDYMADNLHPNDTGYGIMSGVLINAIMNAINDTNIEVTDNFERTSLGQVWNADPELVIQQNGGSKDLVNTATVDSWEYVGVYQGVVNPSTVKLKWSSNADAAGAELTGILVFLDSCDPDATNGYAITIRGATGADEARLWLVENGTISGGFIDAENLIVGIPGPGDELKVEISPLANGTAFNVFINDQPATNFPLDDVGFANQQGGGSRLYSGVIMFGNRNNDIADFTSESSGGDFVAPAQINDLAVTSSTSSSAKLGWTAVGDDGNTGTAASYDLRYSTNAINNDTDFNNATQATGVPTPSPSGTSETYTEVDLQPETTYFFAIKAIDDSGNKGSLSNVPSVTTGPGQLVTDNFNRPGPDPGANWSHNGNFTIENNELANSGGTNGTWDLAVYNAQKNAVEVSFKWGSGADATGIDQGGIAVMLDAPDETASGYLITRRPDANQIRLWEIIDGGQPTNALVFTPNIGPPQAGDQFLIRITSDQNGNNFDVFVNGVFDQTITDTPPLHIDPTVVTDLYSGVMLNGGLNNNVDDFKLLTSPVSLTKINGDGQTGTVGAALDTAITVRLQDGNGDPLEGETIIFEVTAGGGSLNDPSGNVVIEAESGTLNGNMTIGTDPQASQGQYIHLPEAGGANNQSGDAGYNFNVNETADYYLWARVLAPSGESDSFFILVNSGSQQTWLLGQKTSWGWERFPNTFNLQEGQHFLAVIGREDGTQMDQMVITSDPNFTPSGTITAGQQLTVQTDANGEASASWILGTDVDQNPNICNASFEGFGVDFTATAVAGAPAIITKSGDQQTADPGNQVLLEIDVTDQFGNIVTNLQTDWTVITGNGSVLDPQVFTDTQGRAGNTVTTSTDTSLTETQVTAPGYTGPDVIFKTFATAGPADQLVKEPTDSGDNQTGTAGKALTKPFKVVVTDNLGSPVAGHDVTFTIVSGSGNFSGLSQLTVQTDTVGIAQTIMTLGPSPGATNLAQASAFFEGTTTPLNGSPVSFTATSAAPQNLVAVSTLSHTGTAGAALSDSIEVRVLDDLGGFLGGYPVTFTVTNGGGQVNGNSSSVEVTTNANGIAKVEWTLGPLAGVNNNSIQASSTYQSSPLNGSPITFNASGVAGTAATLTKVSGDSLSGLIQNTLADPFVVKVTDPSGNPVDNWTVTFEVKEGGGNFSGQTTRNRTTDSEGLASLTLTLGSEAGTPQNPYNNVVEVSAQNQGTPLAGSPVTFRAQAKATGARNLDLVDGGGQTGQAGLPLDEPVQVKVTDETGSNPVAGHPVTFIITDGGGTINGDTENQVVVNTDGNGVAQVTWYLGGSLGANAQGLTITSNDGVDDLDGSPMTVTATATTGPVDLEESTIVSDVTQLSADGQSQANITVKLTDKFGNAISGKAVVLESSGDADITPTIANTDGSGEVDFSVSSTDAGVQTFTAKVVEQQILTLSNTLDINFTSNSADRIAINGGNNQSANVGTAVETPISVQVMDQFNNGVPGVQVDFVVTAGGGFMVESPITTDSDGIANANWVLGSNVGTNRAEARVNGLTGSPIIFTATGVAANATTLSYISGRGQDNFPAGTTLPGPLQVKVTDDSDKAVAGIAVNFNIELGGGSLTTATPVTNYEGIAETFFTLGPSVGTNIAQATNSSLSGSPISFTFESVVGAAGILSPNSSANGAGTVDENFVISIKITDINGNPVQGADSDFQVIQGGATIEAQDAVTTAEGTAAAQLKLPQTVGMVVVRATSSDLPGFYQDFKIDVVAGDATTIAEAGGNNQSGTVGRELVYPLEVLVTDIFGNPVPDFEVQWVRTVGDGSLAFSSTVTNDAGISSNIFTLGNTAGENEARAVTALEPSQVVFNATGVTNNFPLFQGLTDMSVTEGNLLEFQVTATDDDGDPISYSAEGEAFDQGASFNETSRTFRWTPGLNQSGTYEATFIATDNQGGFDAETIIITVNNSNNPPQISGFQPAQVDFDFSQGPPINFSVTANDADGNPLSYTWTNNGSVVSTLPQYEFITSEANTGTYIVEVTVSDGQDSITMMWKVDLISTVTSVELASFSAQFVDFNGIQISWVTSEEIDNLGFNVLRSKSENGTYIGLNDELIPGNNDGVYEYVDNDIEVGTRYYYILEDVDINGNVAQHGPIFIDVTVPEEFSLSQNYPNPFNPETRIRYQIPKSDRVVVKVYDVLGREVVTLVDGQVEAGFHEITWNARNEVGQRVSSGVYYYRIVAGDFVETRKMLLLK